MPEEVYELPNETKPAEIKPNKLGFVGNSEQMQEVYELIEALAPTEYTILITGETGTGKELVANALHRYSSRHNKPFYRLNCSAIPSDLIEDTFFGHIKGAFTSATETRKGFFEQANGGIILLDEINSTSIDFQCKLLRALEENYITPVGDTRSRAINVRVFASTNIDLESAIRNGNFREDLYYRLNEFEIHLPLLRERKTDIGSLAIYFLHLSENDTKLTMSQPALDFINEYKWPGNVRELKTVMTRMAFQMLRNGYGNIITKDYLTRFYRPFQTRRLDQDNKNGQDGFNEILETGSLKQIKDYVIQYRFKKYGNRKEAADSLGMGIRTYREYIRGLRKQSTSSS